MNPYSNSFYRVKLVSAGKLPLCSINQQNGLVGVQIAGKLVKMASKAANNINFGSVDLELLLKPSRTSHLGHLFLVSLQLHRWHHHSV